MGLLGILLLSVGLPLVYLTLSSYAGHYMVERSRLTHTGYNRKYKYHDANGRCIDSGCLHSGHFIWGFLWPFLPIFLATRKPATSLATAHHKGITRADRRYAKELAQANHRQELNAIRQKEIARLEREVGIK